MGSIVHAPCMQGIPCTNLSVCGVASICAIIRGRVIDVGLFAAVRYREGLEAPANKSRFFLGLVYGIVMVTAVSAIAIGMESEPEDSSRFSTTAEATWMISYDRK